MVLISDFKAFAVSEYIRKAHRDLIKDNVNNRVFSVNTVTFNCSRAYFSNVKMAIQYTEIRTPEHKASVALYNANEITDDCELYYEALFRDYLITWSFGVPAHNNDTLTKIAAISDYIYGQLWT